MEDQPEQTNVNGATNATGVDDLATVGKVKPSRLKSEQTLTAFMGRPREHLGKLTKK